MKLCFNTEKSSDFCKITYQETIMTLESHLVDGAAQAASLASPAKRYNSFALPEQPARILAVDDDPDILEVLVAMLKMEGYKVLSTTDSQEAMHLLDEFQPDVMCIDYMMPMLNGQQLAQQIRARKDMLYIPIIMLTAIGQAEVKLASLDSGVDAFIVKPFKRAELRVVLKTMLRVKMAQDNMLAALDRVAEVQDELLEYEHQRSLYEASRTLVASYGRDLSAPLKAANNAVAQLEVVLNGDSAAMQQAGQPYLQELRTALDQVETALRRLEQPR